MASLSNKLYRGEISYDFVGRRRRWYAISAVLFVISIGFLLGPGLKFGIEFTGGTVFQIETEATVEEARGVVEEVGVQEVTVTETSTGRLRIQTEELEREQRQEVITALSEAFDVPVDEIDVQFVGPVWGEQITQKAVQGLLIFLVLVTIFLIVYFEWKMAVAALVALIHDVVITIGVYAILGLEVTPATVVGVLTILGYSLYDTVVVFDKVKENTAGIAGGSRMTYAEAANQSVNQVLVRSVNTSIVALLPVLAILIGAVGFLGAATLTEFAVALFVGMAAGTYSSIFIATPVLVDLKKNEPEMKALERRVEQRRGGVERKSSAAGAGTGGAGDAAGTAAAAGKPRPSGPRQQPKSKKRSGGKR
jgi:preprotein translocase subunit SecF